MSEYIHLDNSSDLIELQKGKLNPQGKNENIKDRWGNKNGRIFLPPDKHERGNNQESRRDDTRNIDRDLLAKLYHQDGLKEMEQKSTEVPPGDTDKLEDRSYSGDWRNWENYLVEDSAEENSDHDEKPISDEEARRMFDISRKEKYFGRKTH